MVILLEEREWKKGAGAEKDLPLATGAAGKQEETEREVGEEGQRGTDRQRRREREVGGRQGPFKGEHIE